MTRSEQWDEIAKILANGEQMDELKEFVPLAIVCVKADPVPGEPDALEVRVSDTLDTASLWPSGFPVPARARVLMQAARGYVDSDSTLFRITRTIPR
jgi:hypothetical protein